MVKSQKFILLCLAYGGHIAFGAAVIKPSVSNSWNEPVITPAPSGNFFGNPSQSPTSSYDNSEHPLSINIAEPVDMQVFNQGPDGSKIEIFDFDKKIDETGSSSRAIVNTNNTAMNVINLSVGKHVLYLRPSYNDKVQHYTSPHLAKVRMISASSHLVKRDRAETKPKNYNAVVRWEIEPEQPSYKKRTDGEHHHEDGEDCDEDEDEDDDNDEYEDDDDDDEEEDDEDSNNEHKHKKDKNGEWWTWEDNRGWHQGRKVHKKVYLISTVYSVPESFSTECSASTVIVPLGITTSTQIVSRGTTTRTIPAGTTTQTKSVGTTTQTIPLGTTTSTQIISRGTTTQTIPAGTTTQTISAGTTTQTIPGGTSTLTVSEGTTTQTIPAGTSTMTLSGVTTTQTIPEGTTTQVILRAAATETIQGPTITQDVLVPGVTVSVDKVSTETYTEYSKTTIIGSTVNFVVSTATDTVNTVTVPGATETVNGLRVTIDGPPITYIADTDTVTRTVAGPTREVTKFVLQQTEKRLTVYATATQLVTVNLTSVNRVTETVGSVSTFTENVVVTAVRPRSSTTEDEIFPSSSSTSSILPTLDIP